MSEPFDPNDYLNDFDDFDIEEFTKGVDFGKDIHLSEQESSKTDELSDTGEYTPVKEDTDMESKRRPAPKKTGGRKNGKGKNARGIHALQGGLGVVIYLLVLVVVGFFLANAGWAWGNDLLALNKEEHTAEVELTADMFTEQERVDEEGNAEKYFEADLGDVAKTLKENELIEYPWLFKLFANFTGKDTSMKPGKYELNTTMDYSALLRNMSPRSVRQTVNVMIPEGYTMDEIFKLMEEQGVASAADLADAAANYDYKYSFLSSDTLGNPKRLEGFLFPDTYQFYQNSDPATAIGKMLANFDAKVTEDLRERAQIMGYSLHDIMTVASIIEKETDGVDQTSISSVIYNRLENTSASTAGYLQMDSTIQYALTERKEHLTAEDLEIDSPYNTYKNKGLPAGPICNPGIGSIRAALYPENSDYYYFILGNDGETHFFSSYDEFLNYKNSLPQE